MPIMICAQVPGMTTGVYEEMSKTLLETIRTYKGFIAHCGMPIPGGFQVVEFWESQELFDAWIKNVIAPQSKAAGLPMPILTVTPATRTQLR